MNMKDFVFSSIYKGVLAGGASERAAKDHAVMGLDDYRRNKYSGKPSRLIEARIKSAVKVKK